MQVLVVGLPPPDLRTCVRFSELGRNAPLSAALASCANDGAAAPSLHAKRLAKAFVNDGIFIQIPDFGDSQFLIATLRESALLKNRSRLATLTLIMILNFGSGF